jgi:thiosulfate dehydrogenase [quinone] large subunit
MNLNKIDLSFAALVMRLGVGLAFFMAGLGKILNFNVRVTGMEDSFTETWLPDFLVSIFANLLPFAEIILGSLLLLGLFLRPALYLGGLLLIVLNFGLLVRGDGNVAKSNIAYLIIIALDIILLNYNKYSLDNLLFGKVSKNQ